MHQSSISFRRRLSRIGRTNGLLQRPLRTHKLVWAACFILVVAVTARRELLPDFDVWQAYYLIPLGCVQAVVDPRAGLLQLGIGLGVFGSHALAAWLMQWIVVLFLPRHDNVA